MEDATERAALANEAAHALQPVITGAENKWPTEWTDLQRDVALVVARMQLVYVQDGAAYADTTRPESFLCLSGSIDRHRVDPARIRVPVQLVGIAEDQLVTLDEIRELAALLAGPAVLHELHSEYGHDAFLKERELLAPAFRAALEGELT